MDTHRQLGLIRTGRRLAGHLPGRWDRRARELGKAVVNYRGARRSWPRALWFSRLRRRCSLVAVPFGPGELLVDTADDEVAREVFITGGYERAYMEAAVRYLEEVGIPTRGRSFVDVGANIGTSTIDALLQFGFSRAVCFEPESRNFTLLRLNVVLNGLEDAVSAHRLALSAVDGQAVLRKSAHNSGDHRLVAVEAGSGPGAGLPHETVACARFDSLVDRGVIDLDAIGLAWVDVQGHEPAVLEGASALTASGVPVVVEYCPAALGEERASLEALIERCYTTVVDLRLLAHGLGSEAVLAAADVRGLRGRHETGVTDLLLLRQ